jgi:hypothetical protein
MKKRNLFIFSVVAIAALLVLSGCAHREIVTHCLQGHTYGFWGGLWHGFISPFDLIGMLIYDDITVFAQNNNGAWYAFGFLIGSGGWGLLGGNRLGRK